MTAYRPCSFIPALASTGFAALCLLGCPLDPLPADESSSGEVVTGSPGGACIPGQQITCPCPGGGDGVQICMQNGAGYGPCQCDVVGDDTTTGPGESDSTTTVVTTTTTATTTTTTDTSGTTDTGDSGSSESTTGPSVCDMYMGDPGNPNLECDLYLQDCPVGEKCMPWGNDGGTWNATRCSPVEPMPGQVGDPCLVQGSAATGLDDCDLGTMCWDVDPKTNMGECIELCNGCPDEQYCDGPSATCFVANNGILPLCIGTCDPLIQDCSEGQACYPVGNAFICGPDASGRMGVYGDPCEFINVCDPGLSCQPVATVPGCIGALGCCTEYCDLTDPAGDAQCTGAPAGQTCQPWVPMGMPVAGYEDVGICSL
ncbi:MAG: hypothetical protein AAGF11_06975 [Myxococcota bacterium]